MQKQKGSITALPCVIFAFALWAGLVIPEYERYRKVVVYEDVIVNSAWVRLEIENYFQKNGRFPEHEANKVRIVNEREFLMLDNGEVQLQYFDATIRFVPLTSGKDVDWLCQVSQVAKNIVSSFCVDKVPLSKTQLTGYTEKSKTNSIVFMIIVSAIPVIAIAVCPKPIG